MKLKQVMLFVLIVAIAVITMAQTLPVDTRKVPMQMNKSFTSQRYSVPADTVWHKITLPARCTEVWAIADSGAVSVNPDSTYWVSTNKRYTNVAAGIPFKLPTVSLTKFYVRRAASGTASVINLFYYRM